MSFNFRAMVFSMCLGVTYLIGCGQPDSEYQEFDESDAAKVSEEHGHDHDHDHHGPHDGDVIEIGEEEYHAEAVFDDENHKVTLYVLDAELKNPVAIEQKEIVITVDHDGSELTYELAAAPQEGDSEGKSSRFEVVSEEMVEEFLEHDDLEGKFSITIEGKEFSATLAHHHHDEHEHEHAHGEEEHSEKDGDAEKESEKDSEASDGDSDASKADETKDE